MASIRDTIEKCRHYIEDISGRPSRASLVPNRYLYQLITQEKNRLVAQLYYTNRFNIREDLIVTIPCVPFEEIDQVEAPTAPKSGCTFMRSEIPVPDILFDLPFSVTDVKGGKEFDYVRWNYFKYKINGRKKAQAKGKYYTMKNTPDGLFLYLYNSQGFKAASIDIVPENILDYHYYEGCEGAEEFCSPLDKDFHIPSEFETDIFNGVYQMIQNGKALGRGVDIMNNDNDDTQAPQPNQNSK